MDGESTNDVIVVGEDATTEFSTIPLMMEFKEPETLNPVTVNNEPVEMEPEPQQEPIAELSVPQAVSTAATTVTAIRLDSGADNHPTMAASDVEEENMDRCARRTRSRGRRSQRSRHDRSRSRRSRRDRSRSRRSRRSRSRSDYGDFYVQIADDEISTELAGSSRGSQKTNRGGRRAKRLAITSRRGGMASHESRISKKAIRGTRGGRKSVRGSRRGRKTTECVTARTIWSERLRPLSLLQNKKSKAK